MLSSNHKKIIRLLADYKTHTLKEMADSLGVSRQYISKLIKELIVLGEVEKIGETKNAKFFLLTDHIVGLDDAMVSLSHHPWYYSIKRKRIGLREDEVLDDIETRTDILRDVSPTIAQKVRYTFTEMLNNAIDHSQSEYIIIMMVRDTKKIIFWVVDHGIGIFQSIQKKYNFSNTDDAVAQLLKGKETTQPQQHPGEGVYFTSRIADVLQIASFDKKLLFHNDGFIHDFNFSALEKSDALSGTRIIGTIHFDSSINVQTIFASVTNEDLVFDKTDIAVELYTKKMHFVSRSEAKRLLIGLEKFKRITLDFKNVELVGQGFIDEIFRVWQKKFPQTQLTYTHANHAVEFMIRHCLAEALD